MASQKSGAGLGEYLKRAFFLRWNVLVFAGAVAASLLSPWPDAMIALTAAGELVYLTSLAANPRFRQAVDARVSQETKQVAATQGQRSVQSIVGSLPLDAQRRFDQLRSRCLEMRSISLGVRGRTGGGESQGEDLSSASLDRLLWVFLRLLTSQDALHRFLSRTNPGEIQSRLNEVRAKLESHKGGDERMIRSLQDSVAAQEMRLDNYQKAEKNAEFVRVELDRIEAKIHAVTEAAVNRQDPDFLTSQIDSVTETMQSTEKAITELQHITGIVDELQEPPVILDAAMDRVEQR
jgi:phage terminase Nu1 subunit (DNA packaging protein)